MRQLQAVQMLALIDAQVADGSFNPCSPSRFACQITIKQAYVRKLTESLPSTKAPTEDGVSYACIRSVATWRAACRVIKAFGTIKDLAAKALQHRLCICGKATAGGGWSCLVMQQAGCPPATKEGWGCERTATSRIFSHHHGTGCAAVLWLSNLGIKVFEQFRHDRRLNFHKSL